VITRDYLLRQVQQLVQVLAAVLLHKRDRELDAARAALAEGVEAATGLPLATLRTLPRADLLDRCTHGGALAVEYAVALAELLAEDDDPGAWRRAAWLYEAARAAGGPVPFDVDTRIALLRAGSAEAPG
jgi:hypothetical protein